MLFGMSRNAATEFSFFLAMPTLFAACAYEAVKNRHLLSSADLPAFGVGFAAAFVSAFLCVRWLLRYVSQHDFTPFAWYRIAFGAMILGTAWSGVVHGVEALPSPTAPCLRAAGSALFAQFSAYSDSRSRRS